jgi:putative nucleotidyltransferase with HDIG domain
MTKILFVDDEANVLAGLRRMLRTQRNVWEMQFANGGAEAIELLSQEVFDVVVTDMRMPGVDGAALLTHVAQFHPNTVRLVLSGQSEHEKIFRAVGPAHQFMSKPCDPKVLISTIQRACGLHSHLQNEALKKLTSQITSLPSLPRIYRELLHELELDDTSMDRVGEMIESDIAMSAKVLQLVNSSFFGLPQHVKSPKHAVLLLGLDIIRPLALTANAFAQYEDPRVKGFSLETTMHHCIAVATAARRIAESETDQAQLIDDAFIAGMLHDIGKLILAVSVTDRFQEAIGLARDTGRSLWEAELDVFGTTHSEVGAHLLGLWGLPDPIVEAVAFHHRPSRTGTAEFAPLTCVHAANILQHPHVERDDWTASPAWDHDYLEALGCSQDVHKWSEMLEQEPVA